VNYSFRVNKYVSFENHLQQADASNKEALLLILFFVMKRVHPSVFLTRDMVGIQGKIQFSRERYHQEVHAFIKTVFSANHRTILEFQHLSSEQKSKLLSFC
jgi:hypothetical protein